MSGVSGGLAGGLERVWSGWRGERTVHGLGEHKFVLDFPVQRHWNWKVAFYLYLAGTSAGFLFLEIVLQWMGVLGKATALWGMWIGLGLALLSILAIFDHLGPGARWNFFFAFRRIRTSWISRGVTVVTALVVLRLVVLLPEVTGLGGLPWGEGTVAGNVLRALVLLLALAFMAYSGLVLSSWNGIAFWNSPLVPALYVAWSFLGGMGALPVVALAAEGTAGMAALGAVVWPYVLGLLLGCAFLLALYLQGMSTATRPARASVCLLLRGPERWRFLGGVVVLGLVLPLALVTLEVAGGLGAGAANAALLTVAGAAILVGGYLLRDSVLRVGVYGPPV